MIERARTFGERTELACVVGEPTRDTALAEAPGILLWNAGLLHSVGPYRLYVDLARRLSGTGYFSMRFDLSGIGDSEADKSGRASEERAIDEVRQAMDFLETSCGTSSFVLVGLCSGAIDAHCVAVADERVVGAAMLDGYGYRTRGYYLRHYGSRSLKPDAWARFTRRLAGGEPLLEREPIAIQQATRGVHPVGRIGQLSFRPFPPRERAEADLRELAARDVELLYVFTGGVAHYFNHQKQFLEMFPSLEAGDHVRVEHFPQADHLYTSMEARDGLLDLLVDWIDTKFRRSS